MREPPPGVRLLLWCKQPCQRMKSVQKDRMGKGRIPLARMPGTACRDAPAVAGCWAIDPVDHQPWASHNPAILHVHDGGLFCHFTSMSLCIFLLCRCSHITGDTLAVQRTHKESQPTRNPHGTHTNCWACHMTFLPVGASTNAQEPNLNH